MIDLGDATLEWLETDGLGGFASGTVPGWRTRRYHALLLAAAQPPAGRLVLVNGLETRAETAAGAFALSSQRYGPDVIHPDGARRIAAFSPEPCPRWDFRLEDGARIEHEIVALDGVPAVLLRWRAVAGSGPVRLRARPLLSGRDFHALHRENGAFRFGAEPLPGGIRWRPYEGVPGIVALGNGDYEHRPDWYRNFCYDEERARGLDHVEDLASPGELSWDLRRGDAYLLLVAETPGSEALLAAGARDFSRLREAELRRRSFPTPLHRAADAYLVRRGAGRTVIAGYPWFGDWGRDTFLALRGLCLASGRLDDAGTILGEWSGAVSKGMLPNRFPDHGETPEYNSVDASLWFVVAVHEYLEARRESGRPARGAEEKRLREAVEAILDGYSRGTRYGIRLDDDGLLAAGAPGVQLTWMDAKVGDWVVTPRSGKPVEVQALWLNALAIAEAWNPRWARQRERGTEAFRKRFWIKSAGYLRDVVDAGHVAGSDDATFRPNQILAVGGLPRPLLDGRPARQIVDQVEERLWTPLGLRSLAPGEPAYVPRYEGGVRERDGAYHQGTVWPWLLGPFVEAWVRVRGDGPKVRSEARRKFLEPVLAHLQAAGLGHVSEIADAEPPHTPRGCPFQAWSVGEILRLEHRVLARARTQTG
jgi:predicted glycogen debranching enzyme